MHLYSVAFRLSTEARAFVCSSIGSSPHEIKFLQPQLLRVTRCCVTAMNIVQLPFSNDYVHLSVDCTRQGHSTEGGDGRDCWSELLR